MATIDDVLSVAAGEVGYYAPDDPEPGSKYGRWLAKKWGESWLAGASTSIWWCCLFVSWCLDQAGQQVPGFPTYNTDLAWSKAKVCGVPVSEARRGDILIFDWNMGTPATDHIGFCTGVNADGSLNTIEGNTSGTDWGSQYAGNGVHRRTRSRNLVRYVVRPEYGETNQDDGTQDGWLKYGGAWHYYERGTKVCNAWRYIDEKWYCFDKDGTMLAADWKRYGGAWYWLQPSGAMLENEWLKWGEAHESPHWYWLKPGGKMAANECLKIRGRWYAFDSHGAMIENGIKCAKNGALVF